MDFAQEIRVKIETGNDVQPSRSIRRDGGRRHREWSARRSGTIRRRSTASCGRGTALPGDTGSGRRSWIGCHPPQTPRDRGAGRSRRPADCARRTFSASARPRVQILLLDTVKKRTVHNAP